jgi:uncharacterized protein YjdB
MKKLVLIFLFLELTLAFSSQVHIGTGQKYANIAAACPFLKPGDSVFVHSGKYEGYQYYSGLKGNTDNWITITKYENDNVEINGGWQFTSSEYIRIEKLNFRTNANYNNTLLHFDHAGDCSKLSNHIIIDSCNFYDVQGGNTFKFGGCSDFLVSNCKFINNTSIYAGIALNESRNGIIRNCYFENIKTKAIQFKLGTTNVLVYGNYFKNAGNDDSALKIGENGGKEYYCPDMKDWHAKDIKIYSNIFVGGRTPFSIGLAINSEIYNNTIISPVNFVLRILSDETDYENKNNKIINNLFYLDKSIYFNGSSNAKNIDFASIIIQNNLFYCISKPNWKGPDPNSGNYDAEEIKGVQFINNIIRDPLLNDIANADYKPNVNSPAYSAGMKIDEPKFDFFGKPFKNQRTIGAIESDSISNIVKVNSIMLNLDSLKINIGDNYQLNANILPKNADNQNVIWKSSDTKIAGVSATGLVTAIESGNAKIIVVSEDGGFADTCDLIVKKSTDIRTEIFTNQLFISPNPVHNELNIIIPNNENYNIEIFDILGYKLISIENSNCIDISKFQEGIYFLKITQQNNIFIEKFIKE